VARERLFVECDVLGGEQLDLIPSGTIVIEDGGIVGIEPFPAPRHSARVVSLPGCIAVPALINAHTHLRDVVAAEASVGMDLESAVMGPQSVRARRVCEVSAVERIDAVRRTLESMARLGITAVADFCDGGMAGVDEVKEAAEGVPIDTVVLGRLSATQTREAVASDAPLSDAQRGELDRLLTIADGFAAATVNDYGDRAWQEIRRRVRAAGKLLAVHLAEHARQRELSLQLRGRSDVDRVLAFAPDHVVHLTAIASLDIDRVVAAGIPVVACPRSNAMLGLGEPPLWQFAQRDHPVALGTDNLMINSPNIWREMEYAAKSIRATRRDANAITPDSLIRAASLGGAAALRLEDLGSIDVGKRADFVLLRFPSFGVPNAAERRAWIAHRLEPENVVGRFYKGRWLPSTDTQDAVAFG
jgi:cytosine/adenosine deaminase-related metal-dependent hydrolase